MPTIGAGGEKLHYYLHHGAAQPEHPPLLLVHGAGGNLMHWPGELRRLPDHTVYAIDLPGHGHSGGTGRTDIGAYAEVVRGFADALGLPQFVLGGHSMGGAIALEFALRYESRLAGLVLAGTGARLRVAPQILNGIMADFENTVRLLASSTHSDRVSPNQLRLYIRQLHELDPRVIHGDFLACDTFDRMADAARISIATLIICGAADRMTPPGYSRYLAGRIPGSELVMVPDAGHMVMAEQPTAVAEAISRFMGHLG